MTASVVSTAPDRELRSSSRGIFSVPFKHIGMYHDVQEILTATATLRPATGNAFDSDPRRLKHKNTVRICIGYVPWDPTADIFTLVASLRRSRKHPECPAFIERRSTTNSLAWAQ